MTRARDLGDFIADGAAAELVVDTTTLVVDSTNNRVGIGTASPSQALDVSGTGNFTAVTAGTLTVDDITIDGSTISDGADFTIDSGGDITLDADGADIRLKDGGTEFAILHNSGYFGVYSTISDADLKIQGNDGGSLIDALTFDMSDAGSATFNNNIYIPDRIYHSGNTSTYLQFHNTNEFRIVTGDTEMLEVNDIAVQFGADANLNGNNLTNVEDMYLRDKIFHDGDTDTRIGFPAVDTFAIETAGSERFRVGSAGQLGIGGATYGTSGQVLTSGGASAAPTWADAASGGTAFSAF